MEKRRRNLLIDSRFQLKFSFFVCSWLFPMLLIFPWLTIELFGYLMEIVSKLGLPEQVIVELVGVRNSLVGYLIAAEVCFLFATFIISLRMSHNIAGPLAKLRGAFQTVREGKLDQELVFRKSDNFQSLAHDFNQMVSDIRGLGGQNIETVSTAIARIESAVSGLEGESKKEVEQAIADLRSVQNRIDK